MVFGVGDPMMLRSALCSRFAAVVRVVTGLVARFGAPEDEPAPADERADAAAPAPDDADAFPATAPAEAPAPAAAAAFIRAARISRADSRSTSVP